MKRFLALFLVLILAFSCILVSCNKKNEPVEDDEDNAGEGFIGISATTAATTFDPNGANTNTDFSWTDDENGTTVYVRAAALWLRSDTNTVDDSNKMKSVEFGQALKRIKYNDTWTLVQLDQDQYYVKTAYITSDAGSVLFTPDAEKTTVYVTEESLFLRTSTLYKLGTEKYTNNIGATVNKGTALTRVATSQNGMWIRVEYTYTTEDNQTKTIPLYCNTDYTSATAPGSSTPDNSGSTNTPVVPEG